MSWKKTPVIAGKELRLVERRCKDCGGPIYEGKNRLEFCLRSSGYPVEQFLQ